MNDFKYTFKASIIFISIQLLIPDILQKNKLQMFLCIEYY